MLWKALVLWTVLCLAGFVGGDDEFDFLYWYPGRRKLASVDSEEDGDNSSKSDYVDDDYTQTTEDYDSVNGTEPPETENKDKKLRMYGNYLEKPNPFLDNYLSYTRLNLYNRHKRVQVVKASQWFQNFDNNKDLVILMHGAAGDPNHVEDFFNTMAFALLHNADYNVIGIDWRHFYLKERDIFDIERNVEELFKIGHVLHSVVERALNSKFSKMIPRTIYIGDGLGNVPLVVQSVTYGYSFDVVYGLTPRYCLGSHDYLTLTQLHGKLVNILPMFPYPHILGHRNFYPIYNEEFYFKGNTSNLAYYILSHAILFGNITAQYCESEEAYNRGYCSKLTEIPLWYRSMSLDSRVPIGKYYFELPSPKLRNCCEGPTFTIQKHN